MRISMSLPSKTFVIGEYAALRGGPALIANTSPRFRMVFDVRGESQVGHIHPSSPAGLWIRAHREDFVGVTAEFFDPHESRGGFGASSAQFDFCYLWSKIKNQSLTDLAQGLDSLNLFQSFRSHCEENNIPGSGADVVAQALGGVTLFQANPFSAEVWDWPFKDISMGLFHTGKKVNTHTHLSALTNVDFSSLVRIDQEGCEAFRLGKSEDFVERISAYRWELERLNLVADHSQNLLRQLSEIPEVLSSKGCGALGADVLLALYRTADAEKVQASGLQLGLSLIATDRDLEDGVKLEVNLEPRYDFQRLRQLQKGWIDA